MNRGAANSAQSKANHSPDDLRFDEVTDRRLIDELTNYRQFDELSATRQIDDPTDGCHFDELTNTRQFDELTTRGDTADLQSICAVGARRTDYFGDAQSSTSGESISAARQLNQAAVVAGRLDRCGKCDQLVGRTCTMTGVDAIEFASQMQASCPQGLWPGEVPRKWLKSTVQDALPRTGVPQSVLLLFPHGFGDHVQLTSVLLHLKHYRPELKLDVMCRAGCESLFRNLCEEVFSFGHPTRKYYDRILPLWWREPVETYDSSPSTKAERCLREVFKLIPVAKHCRYECPIQTSDDEIATDYLHRHGASDRAVLIHDRGRCGRDLKDLPPATVLNVINAIRSLGCVPIMLDWDTKSEFTDRGLALSIASEPKTCPNGFGDAGRLAAIANRSRLCIGIDSGPGHLFGALQTPTLLYWKYLHPVNYYGLSKNVIHLVSRSHGRFIRGNRTMGELFFERAYSYRQYVKIEELLPAMVKEMLDCA